MICSVIKVGQECAFMTNKGCSYNGGKCYPVVESCKGCGRVGWSTIAASSLLSPQSRSQVRS